MFLSFCPVPPRVLSKYDNTICSLCYSTLQPESTQYVSTGYVSGEWCHSCKLRLSNLFEVLGSATNAMNHIPFISQAGEFLLPKFASRWTKLPWRTVTISGSTSTNECTTTCFRWTKTNHPGSSCNIKRCTHNKQVTSMFSQSQELLFHKHTSCKGCDQQWVVLNPSNFKLLNLCLL